MDSVWQVAVPSMVPLMGAGALSTTPDRMGSRQGDVRPRDCLPSRDPQDTLESVQAFPASSPCGHSLQRQIQSQDVRFVTHMVRSIVTIRMPHSGTEVPEQCAAMETWVFVFLKFHGSLMQFSCITF